MIAAMKLVSIKWPSPGTYILAVSGGVDSMVLLDLFARAADEHGYKLIVAHYDHAMRPDSHLDADFVRAQAIRYSLDFYLGTTEFELHSEAKARLARYTFLSLTAKNNHADGIITAHHQDDLIETSILNLSRGSRRVGLAPFASTTPLRPLVDIPRQNILDYAKTHSIVWHEDLTNEDIKNPRNFIRHILQQNASLKHRKSYLEAIEAMTQANQSIDKHIKSMLEIGKSDVSFSFSQEVITGLSLNECAELLLAAIRKLTPGIELDRRLVEELVIFAKTAKPGRIRPIRQGLEIAIMRNEIKIYTSPGKIS